MSAAAAPVLPPSSLRLALYQPDIPANTGAMLRLGACLGVGLDIVEPCGFVWDDKKLRRAAMDYIDHLDYRRHRNWAAFEAERGSRRLILLTTAATDLYTAFAFRPDDIILMGRESAGVPPEIHACADHRITIPMRPGLRSLNIALAAAMAVSEAVRQTAKPG